ncbi:MAG: dTDP-4-dehydrorhamnose 3,5-epimerase family protein, partial [Bellilinea sp.]
MKIIPTDIPDLLLIEPKVYRDERGFFMETYQQRLFVEAGLPDNFVQ